MPKIFNDKERSKIEKAIIIEAHKQFSKNGFLKTSIEQITLAVGIAQGTFYNFFKSKEALFFAIMGKMELEKFKLIDSSFTTDGDPVLEFEKFLITMFNKVASDPIFQWLYKENLFERIVKKIPQEELLKHMQYDIDAGNKILSSVQPRGFLVDLSTEELVSHTRALFMSTLHKDEISAVDFNSFMIKQIAIFVAGLHSLYGGKND